MIFQSRWSPLVAVAVVALLAMIWLAAQPRMLKRQIKAKRMEVAVELARTLNLFRITYHRNPSQTEGLRILILNEKGLKRWRGPYFKGGIEKTSSTEYLVGKARLRFVYRVARDEDEVSFVASPGENGKWDVILQKGLPAYELPGSVPEGDDVVMSDAGGNWKVVER